MMDRFKNVFFRVSYLTEVPAIIIFTGLEIYAVPAFIISKWFFALVVFGLERVIGPKNTG